jgi:fatty acyl-CoA reductase
VIGTELFGLLRDKYGDGFDLFIQDKIVALAGDVADEELGLDAPTLDHLANHMDVIVNIAATTNFYERSSICANFDFRSHVNISK